MISVIKKIEQILPKRQKKALTNSFFAFVCGMIFEILGIGILFQF